MLALLLLGLAVLAVGLADCLAGVLHVTGHLYIRGSDFFGAGTFEKLTAYRVWRVSCTMSVTRILLFDTETNGLPKNKNAPHTMPEAWPAILQLSWEIYTVQSSGRGLQLESKRDHIMALHPSILWNAGAAAIHGITEEACRQGTPAATALLEFADILRSVDIVIAHNLGFDKPVVRAAAYAESMRTTDTGVATRLRQLWPSGIQDICTMRETRDLVCIPSPYYTANPHLKRDPNATVWKMPRLNELYEWVYGHPYDIQGESMHNSRYDTHCLSRCVEGLLRKGYAQITGKRFGITYANVVK